MLSGGASLTKGLAERLENELKNLYATKNVRLTAPANRDVAAWVGGSMLASIETFQNQSIKRNEYEELGEVDKKAALISRRTL